MAFKGGSDPQDLRCSIGSPDQIKMNSANVRESQAEAIEVARTLEAVDAAGSLFFCYRIQQCIFATSWTQR